MESLRHWIRRRRSEDRTRITFPVGLYTSALSASGVAVPPKGCSLSMSCPIQHPRTQVTQYNSYTCMVTLYSVALLIQSLVPLRLTIESAMGVRYFRMGVHQSRCIGDLQIGLHECLSCRYLQRCHHAQHLGWTSRESLGYGSSYREKGMIIYYSRCKSLYALRLSGVRESNPIHL